MAKMLLCPNRLSLGLAAQRFRLQRSCTAAKEISFSRPSSLPRIFEQLYVCGQGKHGEAVYAMTAVSASPDWHNDDCITIVDRHLMFELEEDVDRHWTILSDSAKAKSWELQLIQRADGACLKTTEKFGQALTEQLVEEFKTFDRYVEKLGEMQSILNAEFRFIDDADDREQEVVDLWSIGKGEDWRLACHLVLRFVASLHPLQTSIYDRKLHDSAPLRALLYLLSGYVGACRSRHSTL